MSDHRTFGETKNCKGCRYWSEMLARSDGGPVQAYCLSQTGPQKAKWTAGYQTCDGWKSGHLGAIDEPGQDMSIYDYDDEEDSV